MNNNTTMNGNEKIAARNIKGAFNWIVGEYYNSWQDGCEDEIPDLETVKNMVYDSALTDLYTGGGMVAYGKAPKEMRFAGEAFCRAYIDKLFTKDSDAQEIWGEDDDTNNTEEDKEMKNTKEWTRDDAREYMSKNYTLKDLRQMAKDEGINHVSKASKAELIEILLDLEERKQGTPKDGTKMNVKMYAFTGMFIGDFEGEVLNGELIVNTTSKGELRFNLSTGKEITPDFKARYANKIERA